PAPGGPVGSAGRSISVPGGRAGAESARWILERVRDHVRASGICTFKRDEVGQGASRRGDGRAGPCEGSSALGKRNRAIDLRLSKPRSYVRERTPARDGSRPYGEHPWSVVFICKTLGYWIASFRVR